MTKQTKLDPACGSLLQGRDSQEAGEVTVRSPCVPPRWGHVGTRPHCQRPGAEHCTRRLLHQNFPAIADRKTGSAGFGKTTKINSMQPRLGRAVPGERQRAGSGHHSSWQGWRGVVPPGRVRGLACGPQGCVEAQASWWLGSRSAPIPAGHTRGGGPGSLKLEAGKD